MDIGEHRRPDHPIDRSFVERWSPRAFTDEAIPDEVLLSCFEAARWAPSSMNAQPWRFLYAKRGTPRWPVFLEVLQDRPRSWACNAAALVVFAANTILTIGEQEIPSPTHAFDAGAAAQNFSLQANRLGWHTHGVASFHRDIIGERLGIPPRFVAYAVFAIGRLGDPAMLPEPFRASEMPSGRLPVAALAMEGGWRG